MRGKSLRGQSVRIESVRREREGERGGSVRGETGKSIRKSL